MEDSVNSTIGGVGMLLSATALLLWIASKK